MKKIVLTLFLSTLFVLGVNGQEKGDWYVGTGNIAIITDINPPKNPVI